MSAERKAVHVRVRGRVQGVGFRGYVAAKAQALGLDGWVRNEPDGTVVAELSGLRDDVETMLEAMALGPPHAQVDELRTEPAPTAPAHGFRIER